MEKLEGPKGCEASEVGSTLDLLNLVFRTSRGEPPNIGHSFPHMYNESNRDNLRIIKVNRRVVSHVGIFPAQVAIGEISLKVSGIGGVATHPDYRKRGYASLLLQDCIRKMEAEGFDLSILWTGIPDFYRSLGWEEAGYEDTYFLDRGNVCLLPQLENTKVQEGYEGYLEQVHRLHSKEPLRVVRTKKTMEILLGRPGVETFLALQDGTPTGYIVLREDRVEDYGGQSEVVVGLIKKIFRQRGMVRLFVLIPHSSTGLPKLLEDLGVPRQQSYLGMLRVINLENLLSKLTLSDIGFRQDEGKFILRRGDKAAQVDQRMLSKLIFGPERVSDFGNGVFPIPLYWGRLDHM